MDPVWLAVAFILGFAVKQIGLPPLVGFLAAGFVLNYFGIQGGETLETIAEFGVQLLLFSIGLKLRIKGLLRPQIWAVASIHMSLTVIIIGVFIFLLSMTSLSVLTGLSFNTAVLIAFALSFSSTVFAVKILEEKGEMTTTHGRIAIGILIMQDIFAVIFLTVSSGKVPSPWALVLIALFLIPWLLKKSLISAILDKAGHGELLVLLGVLIPFGAATMFGLVGLKPDLGALLIGILLANHPKSTELSQAMLSFKDLFLVGFFLTIGLSGIPDLGALGVSLIFILILPIKVLLFLILLTRFKLRARTSSLVSFSLTNYSEFGLIVGAAGVANGWLDQSWLVIFALALSISFVLASPLNMAANSLYARWHVWLQRFETKTRLPEDEPMETGDAEIVIFGMGRIGCEVYRVMTEKYGHVVLGIDSSNEIIEQHLQTGYHVEHGDATDSDFWERIQFSGKIRLIILATTNHAMHMQVIEQLKENRIDRMIAVLARYQDEIDEVKQAGVRVVFNLLAEAGSGYAEHIYEIYNNEVPKLK